MPEDNAEVRSVKSDVTNVRFSLEEFMFMFGKIVNIDIAENFIDVLLKTSITMSPFTAKRLAVLLDKAVNEYEQTYGPVIEEPEPAPEKNKEPSYSPPAIEIKNDSELAENLDRNARHLNDLIQQLGVKTFFESSVKMSDKKILADRYLTGFKRYAPGDSLNQVSELCRRLNMPDDFKISFLGGVENAVRLLFEYEGGEQTLYYRAWLESGGAVSGETGNISGKKNPFLSHIGFKWDVFENDNRTITYCTCFPGLSCDEIIEKLNLIFTEKNQAYIPGFCSKILSLACEKINFEEIRYFEVKEDNNSGICFDLNLYRAKLKADEILHLLGDAASHFSVSYEHFHEIFIRVSACFFSRITGGIDEKGQSFLTFSFRG